jgi:glycosyltransferase involved in cell wall biosynthesis
MQAPERSVLHVLPHPGGGGETYVDLLDDMPGYRFNRVFVAPSTTPTSARLARGVAHVLRVGRGHDLVHVHGEVAAGLCIPLLATRPSIVTLHGLNLSRRLQGLKYRAAALNLSSVIKVVDRAICVSNAERGYLANVVGSRWADRALVVHNGVRQRSPISADERADARDELGIPMSEPVAIWVASLNAPRDPLAAVRAAQAAAVTLLVVGEGSLRPQIERLAGRSTRVLGHRNDVSRLLGAADIFILTTHREGFAFALLEAMGHGLASVVTDLPENLEAIGDAGVGVPISDGAALEEAIRRLARSPTEREVLGTKARMRVVERFAADVMASRTRAIYDEVLALRRTATS